jgi:hypothetical protein
VCPVPTGDTYVVDVGEAGVIVENYYHYECHRLVGLFQYELSSKLFIATGEWESAVSMRKKSTVGKKKTLDI